MIDDARWWEMRAAASGAARSYTCPFCGERLHAGMEHVLLKPEGDSSRRRHAHVTCFAEARRDGRLPTVDEWRRATREADEQRQRGDGGDPERGADAR